MSSRGTSTRPTITRTGGAAPCWSCSRSATWSAAPPWACCAATSCNARAEQTFETLSGGQQARFQILLLELDGATLLLLDEPTDNLDLESAEALEDGLAAVRGHRVAVTHDRWFLRSFDRFLLFDDDCAVARSAGAAAVVPLSNGLRRRSPSAGGPARSGPPPWHGPRTSTSWCSGAKSGALSPARNAARCRIEVGAVLRAVGCGADVHHVAVPSAAMVVLDAVQHVGVPEHRVARFDDGNGHQTLEELGVPRRSGGQGAARPRPAQVLIGHVVLQGPEQHVRHAEDDGHDLQRAVARSLAGQTRSIPGTCGTCCTPRARGSPAPPFGARRRRGRTAATAPSKTCR